MKTDKLKESSNIEDRRGEESDAYGGGNSSIGGNLLLQLLFSRGSWKSKLVIIIILLFIGGASGLGSILTGDNTGSSNPYQSTQVTRKKGTDVSSEETKFVSKVLASTEAFWTEAFKKEGLTYKKPTLVFYTDHIRTGCGQGQASSGPFYCSADRKIYLDISFYQELSSKYKAAGDFAMAYVIAHEVGHHVQNELGTMADYNQKRQGLSETQANALNVRLELQADYYAGAWAKYVEGEGLLDTGDIEEAMRAAHAVGDDTLQKEAYGRTVPDSFTHGTSQQRQKWFDRGYKFGDIEHGDTFAANSL